MTARATSRKAWQWLGPQPPTGRLFSRRRRMFETTIRPRPARWNRRWRSYGLALISKESRCASSRAENLRDPLATHRRYLEYLPQPRVHRQDGNGRFGLAGNPDYLLLEFPYHGWPLDLADRVFRLRAGGITPVLAHPERNQDVQAHPERLDPLVRSGALVQLTAASIDGRRVEHRRAVRSDCWRSNSRTSLRAMPIPRRSGASGFEAPATSSAMKN